MAYELVTGPIGQRRDDALVALICERLTNMLRDPKSKQATAADFLPRWGDTGRGSLGDAEEPAGPPDGRR